jgi:hypothetical protein
MRLLIVVLLLLLPRVAGGEEPLFCDPYQVTLEWKLHDLKDYDKSGIFVIERSDGLSWDRVFQTPSSVNAKAFDAKRQRFIWKDPSIHPGAKYRVLFTKDKKTANVAGQTSAPECLWEPGGGMPGLWEHGPLVPVTCEMGCSCPAVLARLDSALRALIDSGVVNLPKMMSALRGYRVMLVRPDRLKNAVEPSGMVVNDLKLIMLLSDMKAGSHELYHVYEEALGISLEDRKKHVSWENDPRLRDIDKRSSGRP